MPDPDRETGRRSQVVPPLATREPVQTRRARGTRPPEVDTSIPAPFADVTVDCKTCKKRVPLSLAHVVGDHCVCNSCSMFAARSAAVASMPRNAENTKLPRQLGATLWMLIATVVLTGILVVVFNLV